MDEAGVISFIKCSALDKFENDEICTGESSYAVKWQ
jgi:hypothetical protein